MKGVIGKKIGMTQVFDDAGEVSPVTVIDVSSCTVVGHRTQERDGYLAVVLGHTDAKERHLTKALQGHFKAQGAPPKRIVKEFRVDASLLETFKVGEPIKLDALFQKGDLVDVQGTTKGRGMQGVMKRWSFRGFGQTHGTHEYRRHPGAIGQRKTPGRVYPNKKLPGHYGVETVSVQNLVVVDILVEQGLLVVRGGIPGHRHATVTVHPSVKSHVAKLHSNKR